MTGATLLGKDGQEIDLDGAGSASLDQLSQWFESMPHGLLLVGSSGAIQFANAQSLRMFGFSREELIGLSIEQLVPVRFRQAHGQHRSRFFENREQRPMGVGRDLFGLRKDGSEFPLEIGLTPVEHESRPGVLCSVVDISERKRAEAEKDRLLHELDIRNDKIAALYRISELTRTAEDFSLAEVAAAARSGLSHTPVTGIRITLDGKPFHEPEFIEANWAVDRPIHAQGRYRGTIAGFFTPPDRDAESFRENKEQFLDAVAKIVGDALERSDSNAKVIHTSKLSAVGELAAGVGHEINNPINGIINCAEILLKDASPGSKQEKYLELIRKEAERVAGIVASLLAFSRQDKAVYSLARLCDVVNRVLDFSRKRIEKSHIGLHIDVPESLPKIKCRTEQLQQVVINLIVNAVHALDARYPGPHPEKRLSITAGLVRGEAGLFLRLVVEDRGSGIPAEFRDRVFEPFFSTKDKDKGTGLGLAVSDGIVKSHGGSISVESEVDDFTRFSIHLPVPGDKPSAESPAP